MWVCAKCGCSDVQETAWVHMNTEQVLESGYDGPTGKFWCPRCQEHWDHVEQRLDPIPETSVCDDPHCPGWLFDAIRGDIQRCDTCKQYADDDEAARAVERLATAASTMAELLKTANLAIERGCVHGFDKSWLEESRAALRSIKPVRPIPNPARCVRCGTIHAFEDLEDTGGVCSRCIIAANG